MTTLCAASTEYPAMGADVFDPEARAEDLVERALLQAKREDKRVLLFFGANWCPWCRRLTAVLTKNAAVQERLKRDFVLVFVDANTRNDPKRNQAAIARYGNPLQLGLPVFVLLEREGKQLATRETASLAAETEAGVAERVLPALKAWAR